MNAELSFDDAIDLTPPSTDRLASAAKTAGWVGLSAFTVTAATLFGMALSVVFAIGTLVVGAFALALVVAGAVVLSAALLVLAAVLIVAAVVALAVASVACTLGALFKLGSWTLGGTRTMFLRFATLRGRRSVARALLHSEINAES
jgi:hypothetical protein